jgi:hypothetical protein
MPLSPIPNGDEILPERQEHIAAELRALAPDLAGLYREALRLARHAGDPGVAYLLCHAGRELSRGLLRYLSEGQVDADLVLAAPDQERNRASIAAALGFAPDDSIVTEWFRLVVLFSDNVHYQPSPASPSELAGAFDRFDRLLFMILAPYFEAKPELDRLLQVQQPTPEDLASLKAVLARRALRARFFAEATQPGWAHLLLDLGLFSSPPDLRRLDNGGWQAPPWEAGRYLARMASILPDLVVGVFDQIPRANVNPSVWGVVVDAALTLPATHIPRVARLVSRALHQPPPVAFGRDLVRFAERLTELRLPDAFKFVNTMLLFEKTDSPRFPRHWLKHADEYHFDQVMQRVFPVLREMDPHRTLDLLIKKLKIASDREDSKRSPYPGSTRGWCRRVDMLDSHGEVPGKLAYACFEHARASATDATSATHVCARLAPAPTAEQASDEIFHRILIRLLADIGSLVPQFADRFLVSDAAVNPPFGPSEVAQALRGAFSAGSTAARRLFQYAIERGPGLDELAWGWRHGDTADERSAEDVEAAVAEWQRTRLLWFQDQLPDELLPLAKRLGHEPRQLSERERALSEDGFWVGDGPSPWETDVTPITVDELRVMSTDMVVEFVRTWKAPTGPFQPGSPSERELLKTFKEFVATTPDRIGALIERGRQVDLGPQYLQALCEGIGRVVSAEQAVPWDAVVALVDHILSRATGQPPDDPQPWAFASREGIDLIRKAARSNLLSPEIAERVWGTLTSAIAARDRLDVGEPIDSVERLVVAIDSRFSGRTVQALVELMLAVLRQRQQIQGNSTPLVADERFAVLLTDVVTSGPISAQGELGRLLPWVVPYAADWASDLAAMLQPQDGLTDPVRSPVWGMYIVRSQFSRQVFEALRPVFVESARQIPATDLTDEAKKQRWSFAEHFTQHVTIAVLDGQLTVSDHDALLQQTFDRVAIADRGQGYWLIWRQLEDASQPIVDAYGPRVLAFWSSRLDYLEHVPDSVGRREEAKLLGWLILAGRLPPAGALPLARRTATLSQGELPVSNHFWDIADRYVVTDPLEALDLIEHVIGAEVRDPFDVLPSDRVSAALRTILESDSVPARERTTRLVHRLGEQGYEQFGDLLK